MSINDLIHTNAHNAFEQGRKAEQERINNLLEQEIKQLQGIDYPREDTQLIKDSFYRVTSLKFAQQLIKGEQK